MNLEDINNYIKIQIANLTWEIIYNLNIFLVHLKACKDSQISTPKSINPTGFMQKFWWLILMMKQVFSCHLKCFRASKRKKIENYFYHKRNYTKMYRSRWIGQSLKQNKTAYVHMTIYYMQRVTFQITKKEIIQ